MKPQRTCDELGLCQGRTPPCAGCKPFCSPFAPGVVEGPFPNDRITRLLQRWALGTAVLAGLALVAGLLL